MVKTRSKSTKPSSSVPAGATARPAIDRNTLRRRHNTITGQAARNEDDPARYSHALIRQFLECPVCLNIFRGKIFMCDNGHNLCESCFNRNRTLATESWSCPVGRCPFTMSPLRNYLVEKLIVGSQIKLDCPHSGCTERMTSERLNEHVRECSFEPIECPAKDSRNTCGGTMTRSDFYFHFVAHHSRPDPGKANVIIVPIPGQWWGVHTQKDPLGSNCNLHYIVRVVKTDSLLRVDAVANLRDPRYADLAVEVRLAHANSPPSVYSGCSLVDLQAPIKGLLVEGAMCPNIGVHCMLVKKEEEPEEDEELDYSD